MAFTDLFEKLKFPFYSKQEVEMETSQDSSVTSKPEEQEVSYTNYNPFASYSMSQYGQQQIWSSNKNEMIVKWREASYLSKVAIALNEICNEAIVYDDIEDPIKLNLSDVDLPDEIKEKIEESFQNILYLLDFNERGDEIFKQWFIDGQLNFEAIYDNSRMREGIHKLILLSPFNFNTYIDSETGKKQYFYGEANSKTKVTLQDVFDDEQITHINSGDWSLDRKFPLSPLNKALKPINQLGLIEDSLVISRISRSTEKRAFYIPVNGLNKSKAEEYMRSLISKYRQKRVYNTDTGQVENKNRSISVLEDFWFPVDKTGQSPRVENIAGTTPGFTSFEDVDYFVNEVYKSLNVPLNRRAPDSRTTIGNQIDIEKDELKFFKMILKLRRRFNNLFVDLLKKDLIAKCVLKLDDWVTIQEKIKFIYANSNEYSEIKNNQILSMRIDSANSAVQLVEGGLLSKKYIQKKILQFTDEDISEIERDNAIAAGKQEEGEMLDSEFSNDYNISKRKDSGFSAPPEPEDMDIPEPESPTPPKGFSSAPKPLTPEGGAVESVQKDKKVLNEQILAMLQDGDIITNGKDRMKFENGKLIVL